MNEAENFDDDDELKPLIKELDEPWRNETVLEELYKNRDLTQAEIGEKLLVSESAVNTWLTRNYITDHAPNPDEYDIPPNPLQDTEFLEYLYVDEGLSTTQIAALIDNSTGAVRNVLEDANIERRDFSIAQSYSKGYESKVLYKIDKWGTPVWKYTRHTIQVHRLLAVAVYGFEAIKNKEVHHKSGIRWDNRPENIVLLDHDDHMKHHRKIKNIDRLRLAELYEDGDISIRDLGDIFDVSGSTVLRIHSEFYDQDSNSDQSQ